MEKKGENQKDITIDVEDYKLNVRAAGVIIHNGKVLRQLKTFLK